MRSSEWQRVEELFHASAQLDADKRESYLERECTDEAQRREVESLLDAADRGASFIERPALTLGMAVLSQPGRNFVADQQVGHYRIIRLLGKGGMGEVYLAEDITLERQVALKFLAQSIVDDQWAQDQLIKEARAVAKLENANICAVHGIERIDDNSFIVMQYVEGETLATRLSRGALDLETTLDVSEQLASALAAAHLQGIIHRDVKPQNLVITPGGQVKVLDFGLATLVHPKTSLEVYGNSLEQTSLGFVVGTVAYMSPEQARGVQVDGRTDVFSFGIILHEMLLGRNPFLREDKEDTISAITAAEIPNIPDDVPSELAHILQKCLQKERAQRYSSAEDLLSAICSLRNERNSSTAKLQPIWRRKHFRIYLSAAVLVLLLSLLGAASIYSKFSTVHTLTVLPIANRTGDLQLDYLSAGLTRNLSDKFSYLPRLRQKVPSVIPADQSSKSDAIRIGRELKTESVLFGELDKQEGKVVVRLTMLKTEDGTTQWEQVFKLDSTDIFALQDDVIQRVASSLDLWLIGRERDRLRKRQTDSEEALRKYMLGRRYWTKRDKENIKTAAQLFEEAKELDPSFAEAYSGLSDCYALMTNVGYGPIPPKEAMEKAVWNARQALSLNPSLAEARTSMGVVNLRYLWDWQQAEADFRAGIDLDPNYALVHYWYSNLLAIRGRFDEAIQESEIAKSLDPYSQLSAMNYGRSLYYAGRYDDAARHFSRLLEQNPNSKQFQHMMGLVQIQRGDYEQAIVVLTKLRSVDSLYAAAALGYAFSKAGKHDEAITLLHELDEFPKQNKYVPPLERALIFTGLGKKDEAFAMLEEAYNERAAALAYLTTDPIYKELRGDARFANLANRLKLV